MLVYPCGFILEIDGGSALGAKFGKRYAKPARISHDHLRVYRLALVSPQLRDFSSYLPFRGKLSIRALTSMVMVGEGVESFLGY